MDKNKGRRWLALLAPMAVLPLALSAETSAVTGWQTFGSAVGTGRGSFGSPNVDVTSTTKRFPDRVRVVFNDGTRARRSSILWDLTCWNEDSFNFWDRGGDGDFHLPKTLTWDVPAWVDYCELWVSAYHFDTGTLRVTVQATY